MKYTHGFDIAFEIETDKESHQVTERELLTSLMKRLHTLLSEPEGNVIGAVHCFNTIEEED